MCEVIQFPNKGEETKTSPEIHTGSMVREAVIIDFWAKKIGKAISMAISEAINIKSEQY